MSNFDLKMDTNDLCFQSASELKRLLHTKQISSVELTRYFLDRIEQIGPRYNAIAESTRNLAMSGARRADKLLCKKSNYSEHPLLGIPYGAKDMLATKNIPTRWGAPPFRHQIFDYDATVIQRMRDSGAILVAKLAMVELAGAGSYASANASLHGPGLNPWNTKHWSGGSSSGSASVIAAGLIPLALGSETCGSIVMPSAYCGITGLRPTWGRVSRYGALELGRSMDKIGPMARSAEDCGWVLQSIAGPDSRDDTTQSRSVFKFASRVTRKKFHLGVLPNDFRGKPEIEKVFLDALEVLRQVGMKITRINFPVHPYEEWTSIILGAEIAAAQETFIKSKRLNQLVDSHQKRDLKNYLRITAVEYIHAQRMRDEISKPILGILGKFDAFVSPTLLNEAVKVDCNLLKRASSKNNDYSILGALFGLPALTMPMGFGPHGLPLGITLTGKPFDENTLLQIGMPFQRETGWHRMHPKIGWETIR